MVEYKDTEAYLGAEYSTLEDVVGLVQDMVNGVLPIEQLKQEIIDYKEHNE